MKKHSIKTYKTKTITQEIIEYLFLVLALGIMITRTFFTEGINPQSSIQKLTITDPTYTLTISAVMIFAFLTFLLWKIYSEKFSYRLSAIEFPLLFFITAAVISSCFASNKRVAISESIAMIAPVIMALMLVQIFDSYKKIKILLYTIVTLGALCAVYAAAQFFWINDLIIEQYQNTPNAFLAHLAIRNGSYQQMLFEHSLYSKDVRGFFTTGNSAGSFALLASFTAIALMIEKIKNRKEQKGKLKIFIVTILALLTFSAFALTKSKGAILAAVIAVAMLITFLTFKKYIMKNRISILVTVILLLILCLSLIVPYGVRHGRLPGGNSMLVRWQYWSASFKMSLEHPFTGVGPGNFPYYYPHYKNPAALESVSDPHNFVLTILTQFGPLGLIGFLAAVFIPLFNIFLSDTETKSKNLTCSILVIAIVAFLIHNCIDFAIFEPAILTIFWAMLAAVTAMHLNTKKSKPAPIKLHALIQTPSLLFAVVIAAAYFYYALMPVTKSMEKTKLANAAIKNANINQAHILLADAANADTLTPNPSAFNGRLYIQHFNISPTTSPQMLIKAKNSLTKAIKRNKADFKNYEKLSDCYITLSETQTSKRNEWLNYALDTAKKLVKLYPGCARVHLKLAKTAERLNKKLLAIKHYKIAVTIEDKYRKQFQVMYPGKKIFSRLGDQNYIFIKQQLKLLTEE